MRIRRHGHRHHAYAGFTLVIAVLAAALALKHQQSDFNDDRKSVV